MSPNNSPVFEALPVEVLANILRQIASPEDLYSTIRASPNAFGSFLWFREPILIQVLQAHLPPEIFAEFLGLLNIPKYEDFNHVPNFNELEEYHEDSFGEPRDRKCMWERCRYAAWPTVLRAFFKTHFENVRAAKASKIQRYDALKPADKHQINYVMSMYGTLKRFIRDYQSFVRSILTGHPPPLSDLDPSFRRQEARLSQGWPPLSETEAIRLQRGFLRYELCSRLNAIPKWTTHIIQEEDNPIDDFDESLSKLEYLPRWEEEEIRCVWTYVLRQYQVLVQEVVAEFRCDVRRLSRKARHAPDDEVILAPDISHEQLICEFFPRWAGDMSTLGLPMLQQILRSGFDDQRRFLKNTTFELMPTVEQALFLWETNPLHSQRRGQKWYKNPDMARSASSIFTPVMNALAHWRRRYGKTLQAVGTELKDIGWVFWEDRERLKSLGWPDSDTDAGDNIKEYLEGSRPPSIRFDADDSYPEKSMYVTEEDYDGELSDKYAVVLPTLGAEHFFLDRLRDISDWSSKEVSPAFREICSWMPTSG